MKLIGKGYFIWIVRFCEKGDPDRIAALARASRLTHVMIKIADGAFPYNVDLDNGYDYARPVIKKLQSQNISVWGWQYVYGDYPDQEAKIAVKRSLELGVDGYVVNAEEEYKQPNKAKAASRYMNILRNNLGSMPIALSSYRFPTLHASFPFTNFLERCDINMPQIYWMKSHNNAGAQLIRCVNEFQNIKPYRPIIPTGPTFKEHGWLPRESEVIEFMEVAQKLKIPAVNFWYWEGCRRDLPHFWDLVRDFRYDTSVDRNSIPSQYIAALNSKDADSALKFYHQNAVHIRAGRAVLGKPAIRDWISTLLNNHKDGSFTLLDEKSDRNVHNFRWQARELSGKEVEGRDTMGIIDKSIRYHYSFMKPE
jgi:hypothetical protein